MAHHPFSEIADSAPAILWVTDPSGACTYLSRQWYEYTGQSTEEGLGFGWTAAVHPDDREPSAEIFLRANERREPFRLDYRLRRHDGVYRWGVDAGQPRIVDGEFLGFVGSVLDITERKEAEEALRLSEARYRRLLETAHEGVWVLDTAGRTTFVNGRMAEIIGYSPAEMHGRSPLEFVSDDAERQRLRRSLVDRQQGISDLQERRLRHRDGSEVWTLVSASPVRDENGDFAGALAMVTDITAFKELERRLLQSQKMEAVGRLAGGVAHDFNNLLTSIAGHARLVADELDPESPLRADLTEVERAVERASALTRQLLTFSRQEVTRPVVLDLNAVIVEFERMLRRTMGSDILLDVQLDPSLPAVRADAVQIEQVLLNLANNARDAMPSGGTLTIRTKRVPRAEAKPGDPGDGSKDLASLTVADSGTGMDEATQQRVFEPFFTTKKAGEGTGLGLATVHGIVEQSGGAVRLRSRPGAGTAFTILLPPADEAVERREPTSRQPVPRGNERVLVVEDEEAVRSLAVRVLRRQGYEVLEAGTVEQALRVLGEHADVDLVLTDIVMPGQSGRDLVEPVARLPNGARLMFMSGYAPERSLGTAATAGVPFLEKPFTPDELARAVRTALDAPAG